MSASLLLGAGFSYAAGLPLTTNLFDPGIKRRAVGSSSAESYARVAAAYKTWKVDNPFGLPEEWIAQLHSERSNPLQQMIHGTTWREAIRYALAGLVELPSGNKSHYFFGICTPRSQPVHSLFWQTVETEIGARTIVSLNYDILVEQSLHAEPTAGRSAPRCYYGGFMHHQTVRKLNDLVRKDYDLVELGHDFALYKLHGSVNWAWEPHAPSVKIHQDVRAVFRSDSDYGEPAIVPPMPEKQLPADFAQVWNEAQKALMTASTWLVCGYSMPDYDVALRRWLAKAVLSQNLKRVIVVDPASEFLCTKWRGLRSDLEAIPLPGLPEALNYDWRTCTRLPTGAA